MERTLVVFVHGWGFNAQFWSSLVQALRWREVAFIDLNFFGASSSSPEKQLQELLQSGRPLFTVGHSLGFLWLLRHLPQTYHHSLVGINSFSAFAASPAFPAGISPRHLEIMRRGLLRHTNKILHSFYKDCGVEGIIDENPNLTRLDDGLIMLRDYSAQQLVRGGGHAIHVLAGKNDAIVSPMMTRACFLKDSIRWGEGGHLLPLFQIPQCVRFLKQEREQFEKRLGYEKSFST